MQSAKWGRLLCGLCTGLFEMVGEVYILNHKSRCASGLMLLRKNKLKLVLLKLRGWFKRKKTSALFDEGFFNGERGIMLRITLWQTPLMPLTRHGGSH